MCHPSGPMEPMSLLGSTRHRTSQQSIFRLPYHHMCGLPNPFPTPPSSAPSSTHPSPPVPNHPSPNPPAMSHALQTSHQTPPSLISPLPIFLRQPGLHQLQRWYMLTTTLPVHAFLQFLWRRSRTHYLSSTKSC